MTLAPDSVRTMFDRIAPVYDVMNRVMTAGLDVRWRRLAATAAVRAGDRVLDAACGTGDLAIADLKAGAGKGAGLDFSERMLERARRKEARIEWVRGDMLALPFADGTFDAATVGSAFATSPTCRSPWPSCSVLRPGGRLGSSRSRSLAAAEPFFSLCSTASSHCSGRCCRVARPVQRIYLASVKRLPAGGGPPPELMREERLRRRPVQSVAGTIRRAPGVRRVSAYGSGECHARSTSPDRLAKMRAGLARCDQLLSLAWRKRLQGEALAAGGKRLRPLLLVSTAPRAPSVPAGLSVETVHMANMVHDDLA